MDPDLMMYRVVVLTSWGWERTDGGWIRTHGMGERARQLLKPGLPLTLDQAWQAMRDGLGHDPQFLTRI